uniref:Angiotensin-converting enzyme n=1 Tax=Plectus sambesii TaxID=2011161 RepID=A0A914X619_9BILA
MERHTLASLALITILVSLVGAQSNVDDFLANYSTSGEQQYYADTVANWNVAVNLDDDSLPGLAAQADADLAEWEQMMAAQATAQFGDLSSINDTSKKRQLKMIQTVGLNLTSTDTILLSTLIINMTTVFNTNRICPWSNLTREPNCSMPFQKWWRIDPEMFDRMSHSRDYDELAYVWTAWRNISALNKEYFEQYVDLSNKGARQGGFKDTGDYWRSLFESEDFKNLMDQTFQEILPLYEELHTYIRRKLLAQYPGRFKTSAIPAHILGNMWAQEWTDLGDFTTPFPDIATVDVTAEMLAQNYTPLKMFHVADDFYQSLGLIKMNDGFWNNSIIEQPENRSIVCHASAWDFVNGQDFRVKMCTKVNMADLVTIHHEMGHIEYYMQYAKQPLPFRNGANPGFHEAIGDTMALSVVTPQHLQKIGLLNSTSSNEQDINFLFKQALGKVAFLPFGYLIDVWRWSVFDGTYNSSTYNTGWWDLRTKYQGIVPPNDRPVDAFDAGSKSHVIDSTPYISYFFSEIAQFQFYEAMCKAANQTDALYKCDFYQSKAAGDLFSGMLQLGNSQPWPQAMQKITGQQNLDASAISEYFKPLRDWLRNENVKAGDCYGWDYTWPDAVTKNLNTPRCGSTLA